MMTEAVTGRPVAIPEAGGPHPASPSAITDRQDVDLHVKSLGAWDLSLGSEFPKHRHSDFTRSIKCVEAVPIL